MPNLCINYKHYHMQRAIICDLDGTLSLFDKEHRNPYDRDFENDECSPQVKFILESWQKTFPDGKIFILSGRNVKFKKQSLTFLNQHVPNLQYELIMRKTDDRRKDVIFKKEVYTQMIKGKYKVDFVIDDRLQVCRLWYSLDIYVLNVNQGLIEF